MSKDLQNLSQESDGTQPTHFDDLIMAVEEQEEQQQGSSDGEISENEFVEIWSEILGLAALSSRLKSLEIKSEDEKALSALYRRAKKNKHLHWMLSPFGPDIMDWFIIASFMGGKAKLVAIELQAKKAAKAAKKNKQRSSTVKNNDAAEQHPPSEDGTPNEDQRAALTGIGENEDV